MTSTPDLAFRRIEAGEKELVADLAAAETVFDDPKSVNFGVAGSALPFQGEEIWGLFIRGSLSGAAWFAPPAGGWARVAGLVLGRRWWNTGLAAWMLGELARTTELSGGRGVLVKVGQGSPALGETLSDAGFSGPGAEAESYPAGEWRRAAGTVPTA